MQQLRAALCVGLMLLAGCASRPAAPLVPQALAVGTPQTVFAATTRTPRRSAAAHGRGAKTYGPGRAETLSLLELTVSVPPSHTPGTLDFDTRAPDPRRQFVMAARQEFAGPAAFNSRVRQVAQAGQPGDAEVTVFVHGFNSTQSETAFRAAQLAHDIGLPGAAVIYSWPSKGSPLGYAYDADSVLFARDGLEQLLRQLNAAGLRRIVLVAHSIGAQLAMEAMRQIEIATPGWTAASLSGVVLVSPDLDVEVFRSQMARLDTVPQPFAIFVSRRDNVLTLSQRLRGLRSGARLGNLASVDQIADLPVEVIDTTAFAGTAESGHFVAATSPALLAILKSARATSQALGRNVNADELLPGRIQRQQRAVQVSLTAEGAGG